MNNFPPPPGTDSNLTSWLSRFHEAVQRQRIGTSTTLKQSNGPGGTANEVHDHVLPLAFPFDWFGAYDPTCSYMYNAMVKVTVAADYTDTKTNILYHSLTV